MNESGFPEGWCRKSQSELLGESHPWWMITHGQGNIQPPNHTLIRVSPTLSRPRVTGTSDLEARAEIRTVLSRCWLRGTSSPFLFLGRKDHLLYISGTCTFCLSPLCEKFHYDEASALEMLTFASSCFWSFENKVFARDVTVGHTPPPWYSPGCKGHFPYTPAGIMTFPGQEPEAHRTTLPRPSTV